MVNGTSQEVVAKLDQILQDPMIQMLAGGNLSYFADGSKVNVALLFPAKVGKELHQYADILHVIQDELKVDQNLEVHFRLAASPKSLLEEGGEAVLLQLLKGISVDIRLNLWRKLSDLLMRIVGNAEVDAHLMPILGGIAPLLLLKVNGNLDIEIDEVMKSKISENPLVEPVLLDASSLITTTSGQSFESEEENLKWIEETLPAPFNGVAALFARHLGDEIEFNVLDEFVGLKGRISGEGLNLILRNGLKYYS